MAIGIASAGLLEGCSGGSHTAPQPTAGYSVLPSIPAPRITAEQCTAFDIIQPDTFAVARIAIAVAAHDKTASLPIIPPDSLVAPAEKFILINHGCDSYIDPAHLAVNDAQCSQEFSQDLYADEATLECIVQLGRVSTEPKG